jgi:glycosyltransferase involved in cell wall biosynthesis
MIYLFPKYTRKGASSRYRTYKYLPFFEKNHISTQVSPFFDDYYVERIYSKSKPSIVGIVRCYLRRLFELYRIPKGALVIVEKELFPYLPAVFEKIFLKRYLVVYDFDDAIYSTYINHSNRILKLALRNKISSCLKVSKGVITGSPSLTEYCSRYCSNVIEIPTSIDLEDYPSRLIERFKDTKERLFTVGWIGSASTSKYVNQIKVALIKILEVNPHVRLKLIGFNSSSAPEFNDLPVEYVKWMEDRELQELCSMDVGIMPLDKEPFTQGKCGFKLIQYMACRLPTISSPLIANIKIDNGIGNLFADNEAEWIDALQNIIDHPAAYDLIGKNNRMRVESNYSFQANYKVYIDFLRSITLHL